jgi:hypothetical protein
MCSMIILLFWKKIPLEECDKAENVGVIGTATTTFCSKRF